MAFNLDFVCVGAQKSGTTALDEILRSQVAGVALPCIKETKFFHDDYRDQYKNGEGYYWQKYFSNENESQLCGEVDPEYLFFPECASRLYQMNSDMKIVVMLRHPLDRALSHYKMSVYKGYEKKRFSDAVREEEERLGLGERQMNHYSYYSRSNYVPQIKRFVDFFGKENVLIVISERFKSNGLVVVNEILEHIGASFRFDGDAFQNTSANLARESRWPLLNQLVNSDSKIKSVVASYFDVAKRERLKKLIISLNSKRSGSSSGEYRGVDQDVREMFDGIKDDVVEYLKIEFAVDASGIW